MKQKEFSNEAVAFGALELELIKESPQHLENTTQNKGRSYYSSTHKTLRETTKNGCFSQKY